MEEALYDTAVMRRFAGINSLERIPDETTVLNFRRLLETHGLGAKMLEEVNTHLQHHGLSLRAGTIVDATIIGNPPLLAVAKNGTTLPVQASALA